ncbi:ATP-binding cassette domain-containing protein [Herbidospora cretacea]|uniref:ATP-binding cassette domain-containing protein n=1 Tax=Herbidospora cretacea TaxID=28444 RepID=UPI0004C425E6|nr:ATP-binding cassette domain-containing protein [Herbidospora cretacea]
MKLSVEVRGVSKKYGPRKVFDGLDLELSPGVTGLLGPNGAGKSTLMRCLASTLLPDSGRVHVVGLDLSDRDQRLRARRTIGYLPQELGLCPQFSVAAMVDYVAILNEITDRRLRRREVDRVLEQVDLLAERKTRVRKLSGGMRQRLGIAIALIGDPRFLILDEPMVGLDPEQRMRFRGLLSRLGEDRIVLLSTHQTEDVAALCRRVLVMRGGVFLFDGPPHEIAGKAAGQVWLSAHSSTDGQTGWRAADGRYRVVGQPPPDAVPAEPTVEDGYLVLLNATVENAV